MEPPGGSLYDHNTEVDVTRGWQTYGRSTRDRKRKKARPQSRVQGAGSREQAVGSREQATGSREQEAPRPATSNVTWRSTPAARSSTATLSIRAEDYSYVYGDLKRIAVLAVSMIAVLVVLSFIINR
jgi:hypothetical protein